jgi:hypothetical protein
MPVAHLVSIRPSTPSGGLSRKGCLLARRSGIRSWRRAVTQMAREKAAPYFVRWVRRFLTRPASDEPLADQVRRFCEELEQNGGCQDWQLRQAEQALRIYFVNFLKRTDWHRRPQSAVVDELGQVNPPAALEQLRMRLRTRHYSYRTECTYMDWVRRFFDYAAGRHAARVSGSGGQMRQLRQSVRPRHRLRPIVRSSSSGWEAGR